MSVHNTIKNYPYFLLQAYEVLKVSKVYHPIFRSGAYADKFRNEYPNVKVNIPPISIIKDEISVAGEKESVLKVKDFIEQTVKDMVRHCFFFSSESHT